MKARLVWQGNEDGSKTYLVAGTVDTVRVEVFLEAPTVKAFGELSFENVTVELVYPAPNQSAPRAPREGGGAAAPANIQTVVIERSLAGVRPSFPGAWVVLRVKVPEQSPVDLPVLVLPRLEVAVATFLTSIAAFVLAVWVADVMAAMPRGHLSVAIPVVIGLPAIAGLAPRVLGALEYYRGARGGPPAFGVFHRVSRAIGVVVFAVVVLQAGRSSLTTVHNDTDVAVSINAMWKLGPRERLVIAKRHIDPIPNMRIADEHHAAAFLDGAFELIEPPPQSVRCEQFRTRCTSIIADPKPEPNGKDGLCNAVPSLDCAASQVVLRADALAKEDTVKPDVPVRASLLVNLPWSQQWDPFFRVQLVRAKPSLVRLPRVVFERQKKVGPTILTMRFHEKDVQSPLAVTPFEAKDRDLAATIDEGAERGDIRAHADVEAVRQHEGGDLVCHGLPIGEPVRLVELSSDAAHASSIKELRISADGDWSSIFVAHTSGAPHVWQCALPKDAKNVRYQIISGTTSGGNPATLVELFEPPATFAFDVPHGTIVGNGTCTAPNAVLRRFDARRVSSEITLGTARKDWTSTFRVDGGLLDEAWFCVPPDAGSLVVARGRERGVVRKDTIKFEQAEVALQLPPE
jgi:hypothetical protein